MTGLDGRATALSPPEMLRLDQWAESLDSWGYGYELGEVS